MGKRAELERVKRLGPHRAGLLGSLGLMLAGLAASLLVLLPLSPSLAPFAGLSFVTTVVGLLGMLFFGSRATEQRGGPASLCADETGIRHAGRRIAERRHIRSALVYERGRSSRVRIRRRMRSPVELEVASAREGAQVLEALGLDAGRVVANVRAAGPSWNHWKWRWMLSAVGPVSFFLAAALARVAGGGALAAMAAVVAAFGLLSPLTLLIPGKVTVGADGVLVRWLWQEKFIPLADIASVELSQAGEVMTVVPHRLILHLKSGGKEEILVGTTRSTWGGKQLAGPYEVAERAAMIVERIQQAQLAASGGRAKGAALAFPERGSRAGAEWLADLRKVLDPDTYRRRAAPAVDDLWRIVEDPNRDAPARAAAAASLGPALDEQGRKRLRIAADATAAPALRIALEAAADEDESRLADALERVEVASSSLDAQAASRP